MARGLLAAALLVVAAHATVRAAETSKPVAGAAETAILEDTAPAGVPVAVPEPTEKALRYHRGNMVLWGVNVVLGLLIPAAILFSGLSARMRAAARDLVGGWYLTLVLYFVLFTLLTTLVTLPLDFYAGFVRQHAYGLSNQSIVKWFGDLVKGTLIGLIIGALALWAPYLLLRKSPGRWWLWTAIVSVPALALLIFVKPIWIDPLFNEFGPMKDKALESEILALAERAGIEGGRVYEVEKSVDTNAVNAYVTGFGGTKRIVLWDTLVDKLGERQVLFVMGHEMGHYVLGHIWKSIVLSGFGVALVLWIAHRMARWAIARWRDLFGFEELSDIASLPLILLIVGILGVVFDPAVLAYSRWQEREADRFGLEVTHDGWACGSAFVRLQKENLGVPRPGLVYRIWRASHPTLGDRIDFCNEWRGYGAPEKVTGER